MGHLGTLARVLIAIGVFAGSYVVLTLYAFPLLTQKHFSGPGEHDVPGRFPVLVAEGSARLLVVQMRALPETTAKLRDYSFLVPDGKHSFVDQDGDPASYSATPVAGGRQRIRLEANVGDYVHNVEYDAQDHKLVPLRMRFTGPQVGFVTIPASLILAWLAARFIRRKTTRETQ